MLFLFWGDVRYLLTVNGYAFMHCPKPSLKSTGKVGLNPVSTVYHEPHYYVPGILTEAEEN